MNFLEHRIYHIHNTGNNNQPIFFTRENYRYFLEKMGKHILPHADILAYNLMPNNFSIEVLIKATQLSFYTQADVKKISYELEPLVYETERHPLAVSIGIMLSSYTQAINRQNKTSGSLFRQKTKAILLNTAKEAETCFNYLHQKAWTEKLVVKIEDWEFSSVREYMGHGEKKICNQQLALDLFGLNKQRVYDRAAEQIKKQSIAKII